MNEEEKIAFNYYKGCNESDLKRFDDFSEVSKKTIKYTETLLHLIEKQQKEIEEYRKLRADIIKVNKKIYDVDIIEDMCEQLANSISKDKIRELKEKVENEMISNPYDFSYMINELLGE